MRYKAVFTDEFLSYFRLDDNGKTLVLTDRQGLTRAVTLEVEAEPKNGKWEHHIGIGNVALMKCSECGFTYPELLGMMFFNYCPCCGTRMGDDWEEPEINPCSGCDDYDGRGGCKSHGGCGAERGDADENWYTELDDEKIAERDEE